MTELPRRVLFKCDLDGAAPDRAPESVALPREWSRSFSITRTVSELYLELSEVPYDLLTLSPDDFQLLVRDVLQAELGIRLETFTQGADEGIDLRRVDHNQSSLIVQCKRYKDFHSLMPSLREHELPKIRRLAPSCYILATSVPMNPQRKAKLLALLRPFCTNEGDILGAGDLNNLIEHHPDVERRNFKLWLSSALVLDRVLHPRQLRRVLRFRKSWSPVAK